MCICNSFLFPGRYDLKLPELKCEVCEGTWHAGVDELVHNDYWPATSQFSTVYATDILFSFEELKMAAPGMSSLAFLRMLDKRTVRFGRVSICGDNLRVTHNYSMRSSTHEHLHCLGMC